MFVAIIGIFAALHLFYTSILLDRPLDTVAKTVNHLSRYFFLILSAFYFSDLRHRNLLPDAISRRFVFLNFGVLVGNLILGLLGFGYPVYSVSEGEVEVGVKGFFFAGNELSVTFLLLVALVIFFSPTILKRQKLFLLFSGTVLLFSITIATKTAIAGTLLLVLSAYYLRRKIFEKMLVSRWIFSFLVTIPLFIGFSLYFFLQSAAYEYIANIFQQVKPLATFLLSSRDIFVAHTFDLFLTKSTVFSFLFGLGEHRTVEMDFFDTLFNYGFFGTLVIYGTFFWVLVRVTRLSRREENDDSWGGFRVLFLRTAVFLVIIISFVAGHVLYSGMAAPFFAMTIAMLVPSTPQQDLLSDKKVPETHD